MKAEESGFQWQLSYDIRKVLENPEAGILAYLVTGLASDLMSHALAQGLMTTVTWILIQIFKARTPTTWLLYGGII